MPTKKRTASGAFDTIAEAHSGLFQLDTLCASVSRYFGTNCGDLRTIDPAQATALADAAESIAKMFRGHAQSYADATRIADTDDRAQLSTLPGDVIALIYDALGPDKDAKRAMRATCRSIMEDLATRRPYRRLKFMRQSRLRIFSSKMAQLTCATSIRVLSLSWLAADRIHHDVGFERFTALERVELSDAHPTAHKFKPMSVRELLGPNTSAPIEVHFLDRLYNISIKLQDLYNLFQRPVDAVTGYTPRELSLSAALPLRCLSLYTSSTESLCNAASYVTEHIDFQYAFLPSGPVIQPAPQRPPDQRPVLSISLADTARYKYSVLRQYYREVEVSCPVEGDIDIVERWKNPPPLAEDFVGGDDSSDFF